METKDRQEKILNEEFKQKVQTLETDLLTLKSTQSHRQDLQINIERLQSEIDLNVREMLSMKFLQPFLFLPDQRT